MIDTAFLTRIRKMTHSELERQAGSAYVAAYGESYGKDYEAKADAIQEYKALAREQKRRKALGTPQA
jgi:hypothetical protein